MNLIQEVKKVSTRGIVVRTALALAIGGITLASHANAADMELAGAAWVAESEGVLKVSATTRELMLEIPDPVNVTAVTVDQDRRVVWAYAAPNVYAFDFQGQLLFTAPVAGSGTVARMAVVPADGSLWISLDATLFNYGASGQFLRSVAAPGSVKEIAVYESVLASILWVATGDRVVSYDAISGAPLAALDDLGNKPKVQDIGVFGSDLWVALSGSVRYYSSRSDGTAFFRASHSVSGLGGVDAAASKTAWLMTGSDILQAIYTDYPSVQMSLTYHDSLFSGSEKPLAIAAGGPDDSVWAASNTSRLLYYRPGTTPQYLSISPPVVLNALASFPRETGKPGLGFPGLPSGGWFNAEYPTITVSYIDSGSGVDTSTLRVWFYGTSEDLDCSIGESNATCGFASLKPEADYTISATVKDFAGNLASNQTGVRIDRTPPSIAVVSPAEGAELEDPSTPIVVSFDDTRSGVLTSSLVVSLEGPTTEISCSATATSATCTAPGGLSDGTYKVTATVHDRAGNSSQATSTFTFGTPVDVTPPVLSWIAPAEGAAVVDATPVMRFAVDEQGSGVDPATIRITTGGEDLAVECRLRPTEGGCTPLAPLPLGPIEVTLTASDFAGNAADQVSRRFTVISPEVALAGRVLLPDGTPAGGATVSVLGTTALSTSAGADGRFVVAGVRAAVGNVVALTTHVGQGEALLIGGHGGIALRSGGTTDVGDIQLEAPCEPTFLPGMFDGEAALSSSSLVQAVAVFDDGNGAALYLGGTFTSIGGQPLSRIARWDGVSLTPLLGGVNDSVEAMAVFDDGRGPALYVAGFFDAAGGSPVGYVARWDGTVWEALGAGLSWGVRDLEVFDDGRGPALYAGGAFSSAGGETVKGVARWDGFSWTGLGGGVDSPVWALETLTRGEEAWLVAGGDFDTAGGAPASRVALWDGASWTALPGPMSGAVRDLLAVDGDTGSGELYVAGTISRIDGLDFERIARWDGTSWATLGRGLESTVYDLAAFDSGEGLRVVASGQFAGGVRQWDGQRWRGVEGGVDSVSRGMSPFGHLVGRQPDLYVTGPFTRAGGHLAVGLARWARECSPPDRTPPSLRIATPVSGTVTTAATIDLAGSVSEPAAVTVAGQPVAVDAGLSFSVSSLPLVEGTNSILVEATDDTGNASRAVVQVARDSSPPTLLFVSPVAGQVIDSSRPTIRVTYGDAVGVDLDSLQLTAAGAPLAADCNAGFSDAACRLSELLPSGQLTVEASIRDFAGNAGHAQVAFTVDPSADLQDATVLGVVELAGGAPAGGATVRVLGQVGIGAVAAADGSFELAGAAVLAGEPLTVTAQLEDLLGYARIDSPTAGGQHDVGRITLRPACDLQLDPLFRTGLGVDGDYPIKYPSNYDTHYQAGIRAMAVFDDGHGAALYVGGTFLQAGGIRANFVARYDGAGWSPVGSAVYGGGVNGFVQAMTVFDDGSGPALYVGGFFSRADGAPASKIAKWDGTSWQALPVGVGGGVYAFEVWDDGSGPALYVGGNFAMPGGQPGRNVAKWDGTSWYPLDLGLGDSYDTVYALKAFGGGGKGGGKSLLYGGGDFIYTGSTTLRRLAAWNGKSWAEVGGGVGTGTSSERVSSLQVFEGALVLGGHFTSVGGDSSIRGIARWDGRKWSSMGTLGYTTYNLSYEPLGVQALHVHDDGSGPTLFAAGSLSGGSVAKWTGSGWSYADSVPVGGLGWGGEGLASYDPDPTDDQPARLFAGSGARRSQDGRLLNGIASWDGDRWYPIGEGLADQLEDAAVAPGPSGPELLTVDEYSTMWRIRPALGAGLGFSFAQLPSPDLIEHLATVEESGDEVVLALGRSEQAGAWKARGVAAWRGGRWWPLGEGLPFAGGARAAARLGDGPGSPLIMGGTFKHSTWPSPYMAQWDGASWYPVGTGTDGWVDVLISYHDAQGPAVIAAGWFDVAGGERTGPVARWDGRRWSALGEGLEGSADALAAFDDGSGMALYVAGWIAPAGQDPLEGVLRWDGTVWTRLGGEFSAGILDLMVFDDGAGPRLYAAGGFEQIGGKTVKRLARWNGTSWEAAGTDLGSGWVRALAEYDHGEGPALYLAGGFARGAYGKRTNYGYLADAGEIEYLVRLTRPMECSGPDSTPPTLQFTEPAPGASVEANPPDFALAYADEGSGVDTASLQVTVNGAPTLATCTFGASSATCGFDSALPEGVVDLTASIRDAAGNLSATAFLSFRISSGEASIAILAPAQDELVLDAAAQVQLAYSSSAIPETLLLEATPAVGFTCELLETSATCDPTGGFPEGPITLTATIENGAGEVSAPAVVSFTVDTEPPLLAFTAPLEGSTVYSALPELRLAMGDAGAGIDAASLELTEASAPFGASCAFDATGATCLPSAPLAEGQHTLTATVSDLSGKAAAPASITFTVDTSDATAPTISLLAAPALTNQADVVLSGSIDEPASLTVDDTSVPVAADLTFSFGPASLVEGANTFTFVATDLTGNIGGLEHLVVRDSVAPSLAFTRPSPGSLCDTSNQLLELSWSDGGSGVDTASLLVQANGQVVALSCESTSDGASCIAASLPSGDVTLTATVRDRATNLSPMASVACVSDPALAPPMITVYAPQQGSVVATPEITISGALSKPATLLIDGQSVSVGADNTFQAGPYTLSQGLNTFSLDAADGSGGTGHLSLSVTLDTSVPAAVRLEQVTLVELEPGVQSLTAMAGAVDGAGDGNTVVVRNLATGNRRDVVPDGDGSFALTVTAFDGDTLRLTTRNPAGSESAPGDLVVSGVLPQPPDPASVAPPLDPTRSLDTCGLVSFFWTGSPRIQFGVWPEAVDCGRLAVVRGRVLDRSGAPLAGVRVEALGQPDYGATFTRDDGRYDLAGRSGEQVVVAFSRQGYFSVRRTVPLAPRQHDVLGDVVLTAPDAQVTVVDVSGGASGVQVARGSVVTDMAGTRQATLLVPAGTTAALRPPGGAAEPIASLDLRATELFAGPDARQALPGTPPPEIVASYALEISVDAAEDVGAEVELSQPVAVYVENVHGATVGSAVDVVTLDRATGDWLPSVDGVILEILSVSGGLAELDLTGDGVAASIAELQAAGIDDAERAALATLYAPGQTLSRIAVTHFSLYLQGWFSPSLIQALMPILPPPVAGDDSKLDLPAITPFAGTIEIENQVMGETLGVAGTPLGLHYRSDRVPGRKAPYRLTIPLTGSDLPPALTRIDFMLDIAGQHVVQSFAPAPDLSYEFVWDRTEGYGREIQGQARWTAKVTYVTGTGLLQSATTHVYSGPLGTLDAAGALGLGGWSLSAHHFFDRANGTLYYGDGGRRSLQSEANNQGALERVAGTGASGISGDGGQARLAKLMAPAGLSISRRDGSLLIADPGACLVRRVATDGTITTVAGTVCGDATQGQGDGGPATSATLQWPIKAVETFEGVIYIADYRAHRIRRVDPQGVIITATGTGEPGCTGDQLAYPHDVALAKGGGLLIANSGMFVDLQRQCDSIQHYTPSGGLETLVARELPYSTNFNNEPGGVASAPDGSVYFTPMNAVVRRPGGGGEDPQHPTWLVAGLQQYYGGSEPTTFAGDGLPASSSTRFFRPDHLVVGPDGGVYLVDRLNHRIRTISPAERVDTVVGGGDLIPTGDGVAALRVRLADPSGIALDREGEVLYFADATLRQVWKLRLAAPKEDDEIEVPERDGSVRYVFDEHGHHLRTEDPNTGEVLLDFSYAEYPQPSGASKHLLTQIEDRLGNVTGIERDGSGNGTAIEAPFGQRTALSIDAATGYLASVSHAGETVQLGHDPDGLLRTLVDPRQGQYAFDYDAEGRLSAVSDPAGGSVSLTYLEQPTGWKVEQRTGLGRTSSVEIFLPPEDASLPTPLAPGDRLLRVYTDAAGIQTQLREIDDGRVVAVAADGSRSAVRLEPDPLLGELASFAETAVGIAPSGLALTTTTVRPDPALLSDGRVGIRRETVAVNGRSSQATYSRSLSGASPHAGSVVATSPEGRQATTWLDELGRAVENEVPGLEPVRATHDARGRVERVAQGPAGSERATTYTYDTRGYLETVTDPLARTVRFERDAQGRVVKQVLPDLREVYFEYDASGNLTSITPPSRPAHSFSYTPVDQLENYTPPEVPPGPAPTSYAYNLDRQLELVTRPDGQSIDPIYDGSGRLATVTTPTGTKTYTYDPVSGNLTQVAAPADGGTIAYGYDGSLLTDLTVSGTVNGSIAYTRDADTEGNSNFRIAARTINGDPSTRVDYSYDQDGLITSAAALTLHRNAGNGLLTGTTLLRTGDAIDRNSFGEVTRHRSGFSDASCVPEAPPFAGCAVVLEQTFTRDAVGRITGKTETLRDPRTGASETRTYAYTFDDVGRLTQVDRDGAVWETYGYDGNSNRTSWSDPWGSGTATYDAQDRLLTYGDLAYTYTANGELLTKSRGTQTVQYTYDVLGSLRTVELPDGLRIDYVIDAYGRRIGKKVGGILVEGFLYGGGISPLAQLDGAGNVVSTFIYGRGRNVPEVMLRGGITYRIVSDHLGSVRWVIDAESGEVAQRLDYDVFGRVMLDTNPGFQPFGFAGGLYDYQTGLVRFGARDYDPEVGRWTSKDPIGFAGGDTNLYGYALTDPVNGFDPWGRETEEPGFWEGLIPVWGSGKRAVHDFEQGDWGWGLVHGALAVSDVALVKSAVTAAGKGAWKAGSHSWKATRAWYGRTRELARGQPVHHWLIEQNSRIGKLVPDWLKNQPWNLNPVDGVVTHNRIHGLFGEEPFSAAGRWWYGTPAWATNAEANLSTRMFSWLLYDRELEPEDLE